VGVLDNADCRDGDIRGIILDMDMMRLMGRSIRSIEDVFGVVYLDGIEDSFVFWKCMVSARGYRLTNIVLQFNGP
jgi:hypothetical protein